MKTNPMEEMGMPCPMDICDGSGDLETDESDGEGNTMRGAGTRKCPHTLSEGDNNE